MYREGGIIGKSNTPTALVASGTWRINEVHNAVQTNTFPMYLSSSTSASLNTITNAPIYIEYSNVSADSTRPFDIVDVNFTSGSNADHTFFIQGVPRGPTTYYNDICIGAFQVIKASDNSLVATAGAGGYSNVQTTTASFNPSLVPTDNFFNGAFQNITTGTTVAKWNIASATGSSRTGAGGGIHNQYSNNGTSSTLLPSAGFGVLNQFDANNFMYLETSVNGVIDNGHWLKLNQSISLDTSTNYILRICYHFNTTVGSYATNYNVMYVYIAN